jgi:hypothetical protein
MCVLLRCPAQINAQELKPETQTRHPTLKKTMKPKLQT